MSDVVDSALTTVLDDAEKIADNLVPPGSSIEKVLGVLILHTEQALGGKLESLTDKALGIAPEAEKPPAAPAAPVPPTAPTNEANAADVAAAAKAERIAAAKRELEEAETS